MYYCMWGGDCGLAKVGVGQVALSTHNTNGSCCGCRLHGLRRKTIFQYVFSGLKFRPFLASLCAEVPCTSAFNICVKLDT